MIIICFMQFVFSCSFALWISLFLAEKAYSSDFKKKLLACGVLFPIISSAGIFLPALFGYLYSFTIPLLLGVVCLGLLIVEKKQRKTRLIDQNFSFSNETLKKGCFLFILLGLFLAGVFAGKFLYNGTYFGTDDFSYHPKFVTSLITEHDLSLCTESYHAHFPFNAELFASFFVLPFLRMVSQDWQAFIGCFYYA